MLILRGLLQPGARWWAQREAATLPPPVLYELALKINYTAEVRGGKTKVDPSASGQVDGLAVQRVNALTVASITGAAVA